VIPIAMVGEVGCIGRRWLKTIVPETSATGRIALGPWVTIAHAAARSNNRSGSSDS
jgi:hypothetical protein